MLLGLIFPDSGQIFINGQEFNNNKRHLLKNIGAIIERPDMYGYLSGWDNLKIFAALSDKQIKSARLHEVIEMVGLKGREHDKVKAYSQGMKQRLGIAIATVHEPDLLILDEPTNGLDPQGIAEMRALILSLSKDHGKTILISSHLLYEIEHVATRMIVLNKGKKIVEGPVSELLNPNETLIEIECMADEGLKSKIMQSGWAAHLQAYKPGAFTMKMNVNRTPDFNKWMVENGIGVQEIRSKHSLEAYFLSLTSDTTATS
jgi:ABC-type multidrug transport system ATPase subunit